MNIAAKMTAAAVAATFAVVIPTGSAQADDIGGTYTVNVDDGTTQTWTVTPCDGDLDQQPFVQCVRVAESGGQGTPWEGEAHWSVGSWIMFVERPDAIVCDDGRVFPGKVTYSWDAATLSGWVSDYYRGVCDKPRGNLAVPLTLNKVATADAGR